MFIIVLDHSEMGKHERNKKIMRRCLSGDMVSGDGEFANRLQGLI